MKKLGRMFKILGSFTLIVSLLGGCASAVTAEALPAVTSTKTAAPNESYQDVFTKDDVITIQVTLAEEDYQSMLENPLLEEYKTASITVNGETVENVGIRTKGNLTLRSVANSDSDRYSFRVKFNKYVKGQKLLGLDELVLNNMFSDPSYMREYLSYEFMEEIGLNVPERVYANVYINGTLVGFYLCVQAIEDTFLNGEFGNENGNLYKAEAGSTLQYVEGSEYESLELKSGDDTTKEGLKRMIEILNAMPTGEKGQIESVLDVDSALKYIAANTALGNYDSYSGNLVQNYYLYEQNGVFTVIPWDFNMSFAGFGGGNLTTVDINAPVIGKEITSLPLINNLLAVPEYKEKYNQYLNQFVSIFEKFEARVAELADVIRPSIEADPTKFYTIEQFEENISYNPNAITSGGMETGGIRPMGEMSNTENSEQSPPPNSTGKRDEASKENRKNGQRPTPPEGMEERGMTANGDWPTPPEGMEFKQRPEGGGGRGGMMGNAPSIMNYVKARAESLISQLS